MSKMGNIYINPVHTYIIPTNYQEYLENLLGLHKYTKLFLIIILLCQCLYSNICHNNSIDCTMGEWLLKDGLVPYICHNNNIDCTMGEWLLKDGLAPCILYTHFRTTLVATG